MKKKVFWIVLIAACLLILLFVVCYFFFIKMSSVTDKDTFYEEAIDYLEQNSEDPYMDEEDWQLFVSYKEFDVRKDKGSIYAYMWILEESYYVLDDHLYLGSSSVMPYRFTFREDEVLKYEVPEDGTNYTSSIRELFPSDLRNKIVNYDYQELREENEKKVEEHYSYLDSMDIHYDRSSCYTFSLEKTNNCTNDLTEYYKKGNQTIYFHCVDEMYVEDLRTNTAQTLKEYLESTFLNLDDAMQQLINSLEEMGMLKDGGTKIYKNDTITIIQCHTIDGNRDFYIGDTDFNYQSGYCR